MSIVVTGASGFLGFHLVQHLEARHRVTAAPGSRSVLFSKAAVLPLDLRSRPSCQSLLAVSRPSAVIHAAAMTSPAECEKHPIAAQKVNVAGTENLLLACAAQVPLPHLVYISTDLVFDGTAAPYAEDTTPAPLMEYGRTKALAEQVVMQYAGPWTILRVALMYGPATSARPCFLVWLIEGLRSGSVRLYSDEWRTPVLVDDVCAAVDAVLRKKATGVWHIGGPERLTRAGFGHLVAMEMGYKESAIHEALRESDSGARRPKDVSLTIAKAQSELGWEPVAPAEGIRRLAAQLVTARF